VEVHTAFSTKDGHSASSALLEWPGERTHIPRIVNDGSIGNLESTAVVRTSQYITTVRQLSEEQWKEWKQQLTEL